LRDLPSIILLSGDNRLIPDCIPFSSIPHTTKLFADFLSYAPEVRKFYPNPPDGERVASLASVVPHGTKIQAQVAGVLEKQNRAWGASEQTLRNIQRLREGAHAVVTGQQVGLFGGPLLSLLKVASVLALSKQVESSGVPCVPIFWMATEDHDLAEVNQALLLASDYLLAPFTAPAEGKADSPVANVRFAAGTNELVAHAAELLGDTSAAEYLRESYREGETFSGAYARLYTKLFSQYGLVLLDPADAELHRIAAPLFVEAIERAGDVDDALLERNREISRAGYHEQVKVTAESTPLFALVDGSRVPVHRANGGFAIRKERLSLEELKKRISDHPENFNANVLLRPVLQDYWLPTLAYIGGPAEIAYFAQVGVVFEKLLGRVTPVLPRTSATLLEPKIEKLLTKYGLTLTDLFQGESELRGELAIRSLPAELKLDFERGRLAVEETMQRISESLQRLDPTLVEAARRAANKMRYQVGRLEKRAAQAELRHDEILTRHAAQIENALYPHRTLQEREVAGMYFHAKYGPGLIERLIETAQARCPEHKIVWLG
jgi:bacillithiol biosynthesis cysteine-adding enzyme BshC